jgi:Methionine biosynthesis protein MetW
MYIALLKNFKNFLNLFAPDFEFRLRQIVRGLIKDNPSKKIRVLDLGGGAGTMWRNDSFYHKLISEDTLEITLIDAHIMDNSYEGLTYIKGELPECLANFNDNSFDLVISCDVLEHLPKHDGFLMLYEVERITSSIGLIFSPNGFLKQSPNVGNAHNAHISSWTPKEMSNFKWQNHRGHFGFRFLFGTYGLPRFASESVFYNRILLIFLSVGRLFVSRIPCLAFSFSSIFVKEPNYKKVNFNRINLDL